MRALWCRWFGHKMGPWRFGPNGRLASRDCRRCPLGEMVIVEGGTCEMSNERIEALLYEGFLAARIAAGRLN